jgi:hypothetical protein
VEPIICLCISMIGTVPKVALLFLLLCTVLVSVLEYSDIPSQRFLHVGGICIPHVIPSEATFYQRPITHHISYWKTPIWQTPFGVVWVCIVCPWNKPSGRGNPVRRNTFYSSAYICRHRHENVSRASFRLFAIEPALRFAPRFEICRPSHPGRWSIEKTWAHCPTPMRRACRPFASWPSNLSKGIDWCHNWHHTESCMCSSTFEPNGKAWCCGSRYCVLCL